MSSKPSIRLASIVKNEGKIIRRCLDAALPWISSVYIIDTGSTDDTIEQITAWFNEHPELSCDLHEETWVDFGFNRSSLVQKASKDAADYLLLLDADMILRGEEGVLDSLGADGYYIQQGTNDFKWWMPYLVKADKPWKFVGRTHEFLACDEDYELTRLYGFEIEHVGDGGTHVEKSERDLAFLEKDLEDDPTNERHMFYLAQTYQDIGETDKAAELYQRRIDAGGWDEEIYISKMRKASLHNDVAGYIEAWEYRPSRSEALYYALNALNEAGAYKSSYLLAHTAIAGLQPGDTLFVDTWIEEYGLHFLYAVAAWWAGHKIIAKREFNKLLEVPTLPQHYRDSVLNNLQYC